MISQRSCDSAFLILSFIHYLIKDRLQRDYSDDSATFQHFSLTVSIKYNTTIPHSSCYKTVYIVFFLPPLSSCIPAKLFELRILLFTFKEKCPLHLVKKHRGDFQEISLSREKRARRASLQRELLRLQASLLYCVMIAASLRECV